MATKLDWSRAVKLRPFEVAATEIALRKWGAEQQKAHPHKPAGGPSKIKAAANRIKRGNFRVPSPDEIEWARTPAGGWTAFQLAEWGVKWPPKDGWRAELERRWRKNSGR